ncbi:MAG: hypothetical protein A3K19_28840 [Lentisphaerae bacterium RIFOXYB12_FULL_65_16]|nr:MAG: hypothetical protein A3K18_25425 [Lentisphaerae bacterium RIFOXYA12_64_32]OGV88301.1 MAG: hypothetical protein A3K19_28840 [Lentisphaerae bacterium RIFOXYB12_FULL_65_16]
MTIPSLGYRRTDIVAPKELVTGLDAVADRMAGRWRRRDAILRELLAEAEQVDRLAAEWQHVSDRRLQDRLAEFREVFRRANRAQQDAALREALAAIREASERQLGLRPFVVQLAGTLALHRGYLAEMATGEGKTLTAGLAGVLAGWTRQPCHIVTVNDYLAERDTGWLRPLYRFCGVRVGCVLAPMDPRQRRENYDQDVTYTTSKELVADFLRDRLVLGPWYDGARRHLRHMLQPRQALDGYLVLRGLHTAIVDEADSVLVDEAVTPLIICRQEENVPLREACRVAQQIAAKLERNLHYETNLRYKDVTLKPSGEVLIEQECEALPGIWRGPRRRLELVKQAITAREFFQREFQYVVHEGKIVIVDEFTGRMLPGRTWREGLHQAVEAKEGMDPTAPSETLARISFQRFFRLCARLSGMTGTASEGAGEFWHIYHLPVIAIPTNRPCQRTVLPDRVFADAASKWSAVADTILALHQDDVPVLVGTRSIRASEELAARLAEHGVEFRVLNAIRHQEEAQIIAEAGHPGRITIATNMAGRGTDIRLAPGVAEHRGLHVIATERHEAGRIDRQLFGRCARQGDPGTVHAFVSLEDELIRRFIPRAVVRTLVAALRSGQPGADRLARLAFRRAQYAAQRLAFRQRQQVLKTDTWIDDALAFAGSNRYM